MVCVKELSTRDPQNDCLSRPHKGECFRTYLNCLNKHVINGETRNQPQKTTYKSVIGLSCHAGTHDLNPNKYHI